MKYALSRKNLWDKVPTPFKESVGRVLGTIPLPLLLGSRYRETYAFVEQSQWWSREDLEKFQYQKLTEMCTFAFLNSPYYKKLFSQLHFDPHDPMCIQDFSTLPFTDKTIINENLQDILTTDIRNPVVDYVTTGGTSGSALTFYANANRSATEFAYLVSGWERMGYSAGVTLAVLRGKIVRPNRNGLYHEYDPLLRHHYYSTFHLDDSNIGRYMTHLATIGQCFLHAYPSSVAAIARYIRRIGATFPRNVIGILAESENVYEEQRNMIEEALCCRMFSSYGHSEKLVAAAECEYSTDYHVWPTYGFFELVDKSGNQVRERGQVGEIVGTGFMNNITPFIRYRTGDFAVYVDDKCGDCGRPHTIIREIRGHNTQEVLIAADGTSIPWVAVNMHDDTFDNVLQFQFHQDIPGQATLKLRVTPTFSESDMIRIRKNIAHKLSGRLAFRTKIVTSIDLTTAGKSIFVDQRIRHST